jgi:DNA-binding MarR family transcriptional regulator
MATVHRHPDKLSLSHHDDATPAPSRPDLRIAAGADPPAAAAKASLDDVAGVASSVSRLLRCVTRIRDRFLADAGHSVEWSAALLITHLAAEGPMRSSALADAVQSDPSTVSRQVAALVRDGYVERQADPHDGRATLLAVTPAGARVYREHMQIRNERYRQMLAEWSAPELHTFSVLLNRFERDMEKCQLNWSLTPPGVGPESTGADHR